MSTESLASLLSLDCELRFALRGGGQVIFGRGPIRCRVALVEKRWGAAEEWDWVKVQLEVADQRGRVLAAVTERAAPRFLEMLRVARPLSPRDDERRPLMADISCRLDSRQHIGTVAWADGGYRALGYWTKSLSVRMDLFARRGYRSDELVIRLKPVGAGLIGNEDAPQIDVATLWAPMLVLMPSLLGDAADGPEEALDFQETDRLAEPQDRVRSDG